jgi:signal transduction histidine kinase
VLEHSEPAHFGTADAELLDSLASTLALAIDNAGWFGKLYLLGAEGERARIARDLHDRFAQSLASVGFELERLSRRGGCGPEDLKALHDTIRSVVGELRDTLSELRVEVGEEPFSRVAERYVRRWSRRSGIAAAFTADTDGLRLPALVEQELCRILQEALANVERHAAAASTRVVWHLDDQRGVLEVADDGVGFDPARLAADRFGLRGMRERAEAIGASLRIDTTPGAGTRLRVEIEVAR